MTLLLHFRAVLAVIAALCLVLAFYHSRQWPSVPGTFYFRATLLGASLQQAILAGATFLQNIDVLAVNNAWGFVAQLVLAIPATLLALYLIGVINGIRR
jgi:hypothetical protein